MKRKTKKQNNILTFFLIAIVIVFLGFRIYSLIQISEVLEIREIDASIIVSDKIGFDLNDSVLTFGSVLRGGGASRQITLKNNFEVPINVYVYGKGEVKKFIIPFKETLNTGEEKILKINASVPEDAEFGEYWGKAIIKIKKA